MASIYPTSVPSKRLSASIDASSSTFQLNNILGWDGNALTSADFGTKAYGIFRNDDNTQIEIFEFDPSTIASASISFVLRGLKFTGDLTTEVTANKLTWVKNQTIVELGTDVPQLLKSLVDIYSAQNIAGVKTFTALPATTAGNPVSANDLARKAYVDSVVAGIATTVNVVVPGTAGETVAAGQLVYFDDTDNEWKLCDADTAATVENVMLGIAQGAGTNGNPISGGVLLKGLDANQSGLTAGAIYYASNTAGGISSSVGTKEVTVGFAYSATQFYFNPRFDQQLTEDQQDALTGNNGIPSIIDKFVNQSGLQKGLEIYGADSSGTDAYAINPTPAVSSYSAGMEFLVKIGTANTGACTLAVGTGGAKAVKKNYNSDLETGDLVAGQIIKVGFDVTNDCWQLLSPVNIVLSSLSKYYPNTITDQVSYRTFEMPILVAGPDSSSGYFFAGWTGTSGTAIAGSLNSAGGLYEFPASSDQIIYTRLAPISKSQSSFRFADLGANEVRIKFNLVPKTIASGERYGWGISNAANVIDFIPTRTNTAFSSIKFMLEENGGVDKLWAINSDGTNYNATDITGSYTLTDEHIFELVITSTSIKYYVDGTLVATHTTYIPTSTSVIYLCYAFEHNGTGGSRNIYPAIVSLPTGI